MPKKVPKSKVYYGFGDRIYVAIHSGNVEDVRHLIETETDVQKENRIAFPWLIEAFDYNYLEIFKYLFDIYKTGSNTDNAKPFFLIKAIESKKEINEGFKNYLIKDININDTKVLLNAYLKNDRSMIDFLFKNGASIEINDHEILKSVTLKKERAVIKEIYDLYEKEDKEQIAWSIIKAQLQLNLINYFQEYEIEYHLKVHKELEEYHQVITLKKKLEGELNKSEITETMQKKSKI